MPPETVYINVTIPMTKTAIGNDQPVKTWTMTAVAKKRMPSAKIRVIRNIPEASF